uniref:Uncharacterized protein n=1 Tax=Setaria digitata TaxID=48799 RepID=A0A915PRD1_9BILA
MEIEKPVLQQPTTGLLKCYPNLSFSPSLSVLHHHQDTNETKTTRKVSNVTDDADGVDSGNDNDNNNDSSRRRNRILLKEAKGEKEDGDDRNRPSIAFKQPTTDYDIQHGQIIAAAAVPDLDCPEFSSFKHRFSPLPSEILGRDHNFVAFKWSQNLSDNGASPNTIQEETMEAEKRDSLNLREKTKHLTSSYSSIFQHHHRRSVTLATMPPSILQSPEILDLIPSFNGNNSDMHDKDTNTLSSQDKTPDEKRPRIERPRARYPNSTRRTSAPACLWSAPSLLPDQHSKSAPSTLHDNLVSLHKLLAKHRPIPENVTTFNFDPSAASDNAPVLLPETSSATIAPHFQATRAAPPPPSLTTWQWLRGRRKDGIMA